MTVLHDLEDRARDRYAQAGVDIDAGNLFVDAISGFVARTRRPGFAGGIGGFGGVFDLAACGYQDPLLVAATDGVGTKLLLGIEADRLEPLGRDLVAMCVNDLVVQGAEPLFFLDYMATGALDPGQMARLVDGMSGALAECRCALIGGETAEMPGLYAAGHFDLAGFALGIVERGDLLPGRDIRAGDVVFGLPSSGLHANGFSLVRKILRDSATSLDGAAPFDRHARLADLLLAPTRLYVDPCLALARAGLAKAFAHITGGGLLDNLPRILPPDLSVSLDSSLWQESPIQRWLADLGGLDPASFYRTFNAGIGMVAIVAADRSAEAMSVLSAAGEAALAIGEVRPSDDGARVLIAGPP